MTDHLPECLMKYVVCEGEFCHCDYAHFCNCNELRAREQRSGGLITRHRAEQIGRNIGKYGCVITEQQHLPECEAYRDECGGGCICHHVRACEQRVLAGDEHWIKASTEANHRIAYRLGYDAGLDNARQAVAAVEDHPDAEIDYDRDYTVDPSGDTRNARMWLRDALAAIDALKEKQPSP